MNETWSRRDIIKAGSLAAAGAAIGAFPNISFAQTPATPARRQRVLRIAHLTDIHVEPERRAGEGMAACLHHMQSLPDKPQLILTGGDMIMDGFESDDARTQLQWNLWHSVLNNECSIPLEHCIGNHDIWGWSKNKSKVKGDEPLYGKKRAMDNFGISSPYRSFSPAAGRWHVVVLDSVQTDGADGYKAVLDDAQFDWLERELAAVDASTPVLVISHIPILSASAVLWADRTEKPDRGNYVIKGSLMHQDAVKIKNLFAKHANVKLCLSGHLHLLDRVDYNGVTYMCNGAVSGNWWKGKHKDCSEGYAMIDLYDDGSFEREYVTYGWRVQ